MGEKTRFMIARLCLAGASCLKATAKIFVPGIIVESLPLPGWFIVDCCIIKHVALNDAKLKGFEWRYWPMPDEWGDDMKNIVRKMQHGRRV